MAETIIVDPTEVATGRTQFDITPWVASAGPDWGDGAITAYMAQAPSGGTCRSTTASRTGPSRSRCRSATSAAPPSRPLGT